MSGLYAYVGVRYENKQRAVGEICESSKDNPDREDGREFPEFGEENYQNLPDLAGTSAWQIWNEDEVGITPDYDDDEEEIVGSLDWNNLDTDTIECNEHAYIIGSNEENTDVDTCDQGEIVITDAEVLMVIK